MMRAVPINGETWLICGGRDFWNWNVFESAMIDLIGMRGCPARIIHGAAKGADTLAGDWGKRMALDVIAMSADWHKHGRAAGPIRNQAMLDRKPDFVVAFPGGKGTADMVRRARDAGATVAEIKLPVPA